MRIYITLFFLIILFMIAFIFGSQNPQTLSLNYLVARAEITVAEAVSLFTFIGFILGLLTAFLWKVVRALRLRKRTL